MTTITLSSGESFTVKASVEEVTEALKRAGAGTPSFAYFEDVGDRNVAINPGRVQSVVAVPEGGVDFG
jgi:hypothetical protein